MNFYDICLIVGICAALLIALLLIFYVCLKFYKGHNRFILFLRYKVFRIKRGRTKYDAYYSIKPKYISPNEQEYYEILKKIIGDRYIIFPQVPLSQLVEKHSSSNYRTELFRTIDFCIFDKNYYPLLCIEINDTSHLKKDRSQRDGRVSEILKSARLPLLTLWTYEAVNEQEIKKRLKQFKIV